MKFRHNMKSRGLCITAITLLTAMACAAQLAVQDNKDHQPKHHYKLIDLGTFGGPHSYGSVNGDGFRLLNNSGEVASYADLPVPDPNAAFGCYVPDCFQAHAAQWKDGVITDLGALPVNNNSAAGSINSRGWSTGQSQSATIDPVVGIPEFHAVLWKHGQILDLGILDFGTESLGIYVNDAGQVVGFSTINTNPDPVGFFGFPTHTFVWQNGEKLDIGTLGGADALPGASCSNPPKDLVVGGSTTTTTINSTTGLPDADPFLWHKGKMIDLGTLGGTNGFAQCANHRHQVIGMSSLAANPAACDFPVFNAGGAGCHAFFWENGVIKDLGTLGGDNSEAIWLNEAGDVVGSADLAGPKGNQTHDAVLWRDGEIHDLGTVAGDPCSRGRGLNSRGQVVGGSSDCRNFLHAFVWEEGGPMLDLNTVIAPGSGFQLTNAFNINDRGEILAKGAPLGFTPNDDADLGHLFMLIPCGEGDECPEDDAADTSTAVTKPETTNVGNPVRQVPRSGLTIRHYFPVSSGNGSKPVGRSPLGTIDDGASDYLKDHLNGVPLSSVGSARRWCTPRGSQCRPQFPNPCCRGLKCSYGGLRFFCE
jgi:probable HAF family extracellular repeat protein